MKIGSWSNTVWVFSNTHSAWACRSSGDRRIRPEDVNEETVGFQIAPRLNALGRLDDPNPAIELLTGFDDEEAHEIAPMIHQKNEERKEIVQLIYDEAKTMVDPSLSAQVLAKEGWNPGVLGIVAGRLLEELHQPVVVLSIEDGRAKGSASESWSRSISLRPSIPTGRSCRLWRACRCSRDDLRCRPTSCLVSGSYGLHCRTRD